MLNILRIPDETKIFLGEKEPVTDAKVRYELKENKLNVYLSATSDEVRFVRLRWRYDTTVPVEVMGDAWERSYADLSWHGLSTEKFMPWYFMADFGNAVVGCGVMVQPNSFVSFEYDDRGVSAWCDVRCGGRGVLLSGRELLVATVVCESYEGVSAFEAPKRFCKVMSPNPVLPKFPVYGSNNWYYAYGKSSGEEIRNDAKIIAELTEGLENRPFMVIDDGWTPNACAGPWIPNENHVDMKAIADDFKAMGVRPGIWIRPLRDLDMMERHPEWLLENVAITRERYLDPSHPEVKEYLRKTVSEIRSWGYELLKYDFTTNDIFGQPGVFLNGVITAFKDWSFYDKTKTSAEIVKELYQLLREAFAGGIMLGCNTVSHLSAGLVEMSRIGDDTSGYNWHRTRGIGINTLAFRLPQHGAFYAIDADCVGILDKNIDWRLNRQWLKLLAKSGSPLFVSAHPASLTEEMKKDLKEAYRINSVQTDVSEPLDWKYNQTPSHWLVNGERVEFDWVLDTPPAIYHSKFSYPMK